MSRCGGVDVIAPEEFTGLLLENSLNAVATPKIIGILAVIITLVVFAGVAVSVWVRYPDNHTENPIALKLVSVLALATGAGLLYWQRRFAVVLMFMAAWGFMADYALDHANVLISYEEWIERGMPEWGQVINPSH